MEKQEREEENKTNKEHLAAVDLSKITKKVPVPLIEDEPRTTIGEKLRIWLMIILSVLIGVVALIIGGAVLFYFRHLSDPQFDLNGISKLLQLTVTSILVPLITLFLGYIFGRKLE
jgi:hypothetical protein